MKIRGLIDEDFVNYKKPCMFISTATCSFKCEKESGVHCCQNSSLAKSPVIETRIAWLVRRYLSNAITSAICFGGLEPIDQIDDLIEFITCLRTVSNDDVVIYTGYYKDEIEEQLERLRQFENIIVKFGRFIPGDIPHFDQILGVNLASQNQFAEKIS